METFKLVKNDAGHYQQESKEQSSILNAIHAILEDGGINFDFLSDWLHNTQFSTLHSNLCAFIKVGNEIIITSHDDHAEHPNSYICIDQAQLISLIDQWKIINDKKPGEVVITNSDGDINITCEI